MNTSTQDHGREQADRSILDAIPTPDEIREEMTKNAEENRLLRSLYRLSRRVHQRTRQTPETRQGVANAKA